VTLSSHPARATPRKPAGFRQDKEFLRLPVDSILTWVTCSLCSTALPRFIALTKQCARDRCIGTFGLVESPLVPFPLVIMQLETRILFSLDWLSSSLEADCG